MLVDWANMVSADVVARLASESMPPLVDSEVLLGPENTVPVMTSAAPRMTLVPLGGTLTKKSPQTPSAVTSQALYQAMITQPWIWTDVQQWRADISGVQYTDGVAASDLAQNWDYTSAMLYVLIQSLWALGEGTWKPHRYEWIDSKASSGKLGGFGRMISFFFEVYSPVLLYNLQAPAALAGPGLGLLGTPNNAEVSIGYAGGTAADELTITTPT